MQHSEGRPHSIPRPAPPQPDTQGRGSPWGHGGPGQGPGPKARRAGAARGVGGTTADQHEGAPTQAPSRATLGPGQAPPSASGVLHDRSSTHGNRSATKREGRRAPGDAGAPRNHRLREGAGLTGRGPCGSHELSRAQDTTGTENRGAAARGWGGVGVTADRARAVPLDRRDGLQPDRGGVGTTRGSPGCRRALPFTWLTSCYMNARSIKKPSRKCLIWQTG